MWNSAENANFDSFLRPVTLPQYLAQAVDRQSSLAQVLTCMLSPPGAALCQNGNISAWSVVKYPSLDQASIFSQLLALVSRYTFALTQLKTGHGLEGAKTSSKLEQVDKRLN